MAASTPARCACASECSRSERDPALVSLGSQSAYFPRACGSAHAISHYGSFVHRQMYEKYNAVLRAQSGIPFLASKFEKLCGDNNYRTTLHAINSCVIKLSKVRAYSACSVCVLRRRMCTLLTSHPHIR